MIIPEIFLLIAIGVLVIPSFYYWIYPYPKNVKLRKDELNKLHNDRVAQINYEIEVAKKHQNTGTKVSGGGEPWAQAERDELSLKDKLYLENVNYNEKIKEIEKFPLTNALVILSIFLTLIGLYLASLDNHPKTYEPKKVIQPTSKDGMAN